MKVKLPQHRRPRGRFRLACGRWSGALILVATVTGCTSATSGSPTTGAFVPPFVGTLLTAPGTAAIEFDHGVRVAMLELVWSSYEPQEGKFDSRYEQKIMSELGALQAAGMRVTLGLGMHYTPSWVSRIPDSKFVDQNGRVSDQVDFTFNAAVRSAGEVYIRRVNDVLGLSNFWAIRITSGGSAELLYPSGGSYWAYGPNAQNGPGRPKSVPDNPFPGWRPGEQDLDAEQVRKWYEWYVAALADTAQWQLTLFASLGFIGFYQILTPGTGVQPAVLDRMVAGGLPAGVAGRGAAWADIYRLLPHRRDIVAYVTSVADGSGGNDQCAISDQRVALNAPQVSGWSATRWISRIADGFGLAKAGENPGYGLPERLNQQYRDGSASGMMAQAFGQAKSCGFQGLYWAHDDQLWDGTVDVRWLYGYTSATAGLPPPVIR